MCVSAAGTKRDQLEWRLGQQLETHRRSRHHHVCGASNGSEWGVSVSGVGGAVALCIILLVSYRLYIHSTNYWGGTGVSGVGASDWSQTRDVGTAGLNQLLEQVGSK